MSKKDIYTSRVTRCFEILEELFSNYPSSIDEIEEDLASSLEYYKDLSTYVPEQKVELELFKGTILLAEGRSPLILDLED